MDIDWSSNRQSLFLDHVLTIHPWDHWNLLGWSLQSSTSTAFPWRSKTLSATVSRFYLKALLHHRIVFAHGPCYESTSCTSKSLLAIDFEPIDLLKGRVSPTKWLRDVLAVYT